MKTRLLLISLSAILLAGCASSGVIPIGENRYMISDSNGLYYDGGSVLADIMKEASAYCAKQGKKAELLNSKTEDAAVATGILLARKSATAQIQFTCK